MNDSEKKNMLFLSGNEALARGAWECGVRVAAAYPGTPSTEILEAMSQYGEVQSQWSVNEKVAYEVAYAAAIGGVRSLYASKHVGVNVAMDPLMTSVYMGVNAGFVAVTADDPGLHSSQNEQDNRHVARFAKMPLIEPSSPSDTIRFIREAYLISERFDIPVLFRMTTRVSHSKENVITGPREESVPKGFVPDMQKYVMVPRNAMFRHIDLEKRIHALTEYANTTWLNEMELKNPSIGFITDSVTYLYVKEMYPDASVLKLGMPWPFPGKLVEDFASRVKKLYVIEELDPFIEEQVRLLGLRPEVRKESFWIGELRPEHIPEIVEGREKPGEKSGQARKPQLCPGCPHNTVYEILKKHDLIVAGDIGCYTLGALPPLSSLQTCVCMGGSLTFFQGLQKAGNRRVAAVIGDSTFVHTGVPGLINAAYNGDKGLILILDNATTAMTGNQPHPGTGTSITGGETKKLILEDIAKACGADNVDVVNPYRRSELDALITKRLSEDALSVIIARAPCMLLLKRDARDKAVQDAGGACASSGEVVK